MKNKIQIITVDIPSANAVVNIDAETDIKHQEVKGLYVSSTKELIQTTGKLTIDGNEILPKDFELALLQPTSANSYKEVAMPVDEKAKGSKVKGEIIDGGVASAYPYRISVYLLNVE